MTILTTQRLEMRPFTIADIDELYELIQDDSIAWCLPGIYTDSKETLERTLNIYTKADFKNDIYFALNEKSSGKLIGVIVLVKTYKNMMELSYCITRKKRGCGMMLEGVKALLKWYSEQKFNNTIVINVMNSNHSSIRLCQKMQESKIPILRVFSNDIMRYYIIRPWCLK